MSPLVSFLVIAGTMASLLFFFLILHLNRTVGKEGETTGHEYDGIKEYDNPLPAWWYWKFVLTIVFALGYLAWYPGLGNFKGLGNWTSTGELEADQVAAEARYGPIFAEYAALNLDEIAASPKANKMGRRLYVNNCSVCHGAEGKGSFGFPNLTDSEWLWGSSEEAILQTLRHGRQAAMPGWGDILGDEGVKAVSSYVEQLAGREVDQSLANAGQAHYQQFCAVCHGPEGKGQPVFGAPNLTNEIWLYGGSTNRIQHIVRHGRNGQMPAFADKLGEDRVKILAGFVRSLSLQQSETSAPAGQ